MIKKPNIKNNIEKFEIRYNQFIDDLKDKKDISLENVEKVRNNFIKQIDLKLDELYKKKDFLFEIKTRKIALMKHKVSVWKKFRRTKLNMLVRYLVSMPFIYMMWIPAIIMHIFLEIYHQICFRLYKIPLVNPKEYFIFDRRHLPYLNWFEKFNCFFCSYFNCLVGYTREIAGRTERYWCPIKHSMNIKGQHTQYHKFYEHAKAEGFRKYWKETREFK